MNISAIIAQFPVTLSIQNNLMMINNVLAQTNPGDWVLFPEGSLSGYSTDLSFLKQIDQQELLAGLKHIQKEATKRKINIWVGSCVIENRQWLNAAYGFTADGETMIYHKINLANHERGTFSAGNNLPVFKINIPEGNIIVGVQLCRELRFPEQWGWLARSGAQIILHLNNAVDDNSILPVWKSHLVSRAAETQRFVLSANNAALEQKSPTIAVSPSGMILGELVSPEFGFLRVKIDMSEVSNWYLDQCRTDVVAISSKIT
jgi:predicted amidohydrolase